MRFRFIIFVLLALLITAGFVGVVSADRLEFDDQVINGLTVKFTPDTDIQNITEWNWDFGDENKGTIRSPEHTYSKIGEYKVTLTIKSDDIDSVTPYSRIVYLNAINPTNLKFEATPKSSITTTTEITFTFSADNAVKFKIDYDGEGEGVAVDAISGVKHTYTKKGTYKPVITAISATGDLVTKNIDSITVANTPVSLVEIVDITEPRTGETADTNGNPKSNNINVGTVTWTPALKNNKFENGKEYTAELTVTPIEGYEFIVDGTSATKVKINDEYATISATGKTTTSLKISYKFDKTTPAISSVILTITEPSTGNKPTTSITSSTTGVDASKSTVTWDPDDNPFEAGEDYTATIIVPTLEGYTYATSPKVYLNGDDDELESGVSVNDDGELEVEYTFTNDISKVYLTITEPSVGAKPDTSAEATDDLVTVNNPITWDTDDTTFSAGSSYKVTINVDKKSTLNYADTLTYYINNKEAKATKNDDKSYDITYTFITASDISKIVITLNAPVAGSSAPSTAHISSNPFNAVDGTVSWNPSVSIFASDTAYTANIKVNAFSGYRFTLSVTATVNGDAAKVTRTSDSSVTVSYTYPRTAKAYTDVPTIEPTKTQTPETTSSGGDVSIPNPIGIIHELVKLFLSMFDFNNYVMTETQAATEQ